MVAAAPAAAPSSPDEPAAKPNVARFALPKGPVPIASTPAALPSAAATPAKPTAAAPSTATTTATPRPLPPMPGYTPTAPVSQPTGPTAPLPPPAEPETPASSQKKVARLAASGNAPSTVSLTTEGKLPELHLAEAVAKPKGEAPKKVNPIVLAAALTFSVVSSLAILFLSDGDKSNVTEVDSAQKARSQLMNYLPKPPNPDKPYQSLIRVADQAHARKDFADERDAYRKVLKLLREERSPYKGLTGSPRSDHELERLLEKLLATDES